MTSNQIAYWSLQETKRANKVREKETNRSNLANEGLKDKQINLTYNLGLLNLAETTRANKAREAETNRHNLVMESQGLAGLMIQQQNADTNARNVELGFASLAETTRSHMANEAIGFGQLAELQRNNDRNFVIGIINSTAQVTSTLMGSQTNLMNAFTNARNASINQQNADTNAKNATTREWELLETTKHNRNVEEETKRNNLTDQMLETARLGMDNSYKAADSVSKLSNASINAIKLLKGGK